MNNKIGIGIVTYNSPERLKASAATVPTNVDKFVIVNDGTGHLYPNDVYPKHAEVINHSKNLCVGCAKNTTIRALIQAECEHIFIMEDDILIKNDQVFNAYITAAKISGLYTMAFALHGPANLKDGKPFPRDVVQYSKDITISFYIHSVGAFEYFHRGVIKNAGYYDERFKNAWEHVDHSYRIVKMGLLPAYWCWPDIANSGDYLQEIASSEVNSVIRKTDEWKQNFQNGAHLFKHLHGYFPTEVPDTPRDVIIERLKAIKQNYGGKV